MTPLSTYRPLLASGSATPHPTPSLILTPGISRPFAFCESYVSVTRLMVCLQTDASTLTDPDCLGPCEPGTSVVLEGLVWAESNNGMCTLTHPVIAVLRCLSRIWPRLSVRRPSLPHELVTQEQTAI